MRKIAVLFAVVFSLSAADGPGDLIVAAPSRTGGLVKSVTIQGGETSVALRTRPGIILDQDTLRKDVRTLYSTGQFTDIGVRTVDEPEGTAVTFEVTPKDPLYLRDLRMEPNTFGMQPTLVSGTPIDPAAARKVADVVRRKLVEKGYVGATVEPEIKPVGKNKADIILYVTAGESVKVKDVEVVGDTVFSEKQILKALDNLRVKKVVPGVPGIWHGYTMYPAYSEEAVQADLAKLQSFYLARGYFDAKVRLDDSKVEGDNAHVKLYVDAGPQYKINQLEFSGQGIQHTVETPVNGLFATRYFCDCLMRARREAEKHGVVDFTARLNYHKVDETAAHQPIADLTAEVEQGKQYTIGRIELNGLKKYKDATVRKNLLLDEQDLLDETKLRKSIARLNQSQMFEPLEENQIAVNTDERTGIANIVIPLREKRKGTWNLSGPIGPVSLAGAFQGMIASRLPGWGQGLFELSTYYVSFSLLAYGSPIGHIVPLALGKQGILPIFSLMRPFTPGEGWKSGFLIAPQLGWRTSLYSYGTAQVTSRLLPLLQGDRRYQSNLSVTFERPFGDGVLICDPPKQKYHALRMGASIFLQFAGSLPTL